MIDRLESSSSDKRTTKSLSTRKLFHEDQSDSGASVPSSSPATKRIARRETHHITPTSHETIKGNFDFRHKSPHEEIVVHRQHPSNSTPRFELDREEILNGGRRTASGTTVMNIHIDC
jgi:hypothetical protein